MPWFKVDDKLWGSPKWIGTSPAARGLWVTAGSWCADQTQDGLVPTHVLAVLGGRPKDAAELVTVGLWESDPRGWRFHDWHSYQPSREQVEAQRTAARERQRKAREAAKSRRDNTVTHAEVTAVVTLPPTRPDPTRPKEEEVAPRKKRATPPAAQPADPRIGPIVGAYCDGATGAKRVRPSESLRARCGKAAGQLLAEGVPVEIVTAAARAMGAAGWTDLALQVQKLPDQIPAQRPPVDLDKAWMRGVV